MVLKHLTNFRVLDYRGNKIECPKRYRMKVIEQLKHLTYLNDCPVSALDRKKLELFLQNGEDGIKQALDQERRNKQKSHQNYILEIKEAKRKAKDSNARKLR